MSDKKTVKTAKTTKAKNICAKKISISVSVILIAAAVIITVVLSGRPGLSVPLFCAELKNGEKIDSFSSFGEYFFILPDGNHENSLRLSWQGECALSCGNEKTENGEIVSWYHDGVSDYALQYGKDALVFHIYKEDTLPSLFVDTQSGGMEQINADKEYKESGSFRLYENGNITLNAALKYIKGRGNSTWEYEKKPYNIAFEEKQSPLGMKEAKKWCLLSNPIDRSNLKNDAGFYIARIMGCKNTPEGKFVQLYLNGAYAGLYYLTEKVEVGENRINIADLEKENEKTAGTDAPAERAVTGDEGKPGYAAYYNASAGPDVISGGYLLELDRYAVYEKEDVFFISGEGQTVVVKSPENITKNESEYISALWNEAEEAVYSRSGYNRAGKYYTEYFDMPSLINMYLFYEFIMQPEAGVSSTFFYKDAESDVFSAGPVWDMDSAYYLKTGDGGFVFTPSESYMLPCVHNTVSDHDSYPAFFAMLFYHEDFREALSQRFSEIKKELEKNSPVRYINETSEKLLRSVLYNDLLFMGGDNFPGLDILGENVKTNGGQLSDFISARLSSMEKYYIGCPSAVFYFSDEKMSFMTDGKMYLPGDTVTVMSGDDLIPYLASSSGKTDIKGWTTSPDGFGKFYAAGDTFILEGTVCELYAVRK